MCLSVMAPYLLLVNLIVSLQRQTSSIKKRDENIKIDIPESPGRVQSS